MAQVIDIAPTRKGNDNWIEVVPETDSEWENVDEPIGTPDTADYLRPALLLVSAGELGFPDLPANADVVSEITVTFHHKATGKAGSLGTAFVPNGSAEFSEKTIASLLEIWGTGSVTWSGLSLPVAEYNGHQLKIRQVGALGVRIFATVAITVTYSELAAGNPWYLYNRRRRIQ